VVRRHSGGGAVLLHPGRSLWIDVLLPRADPRWDDDVGTSFHWLGAVWAAALTELGVPAEVHTGGLEKTAWGQLVCFGSVGPGEVSVGGRKVVGLSQRRTRGGARFQCLVHDEWDPAELLTLLVLAPADRTAAAADLRDRAAGPGVPLAELERAVLDRLT
jgi:lipoate-protein ligase A